MFKVGKNQYINMRKNVYIHVNRGTIQHDRYKYHAMRKPVFFGVRRCVEAEVGFLIPFMPY